MKKAIQIESMINLLIKRDLVIDNIEHAMDILSKINYYKLTPYFRFFQDTDLNFKCKTSFDNVLDLYEFDKELRLLFFNKIEIIETWIKTTIANHLAHFIKNDFDYFRVNDSTIYDNSFEAMDIIRKIVKRCEKEHEKELVRLYSTEHEKDKGIPIWIGIELLTLGDVLQLFKCLSNYLKNKIINDMGFKNIDMFQESINSLRIVRNICAHNNRLWNETFYSPRKLLKGSSELWNYISTKHCVSYNLGVIAHLLGTKHINEMLSKISELVDKFHISWEHMGINKLCINQILTK